MVDRQKVEKSDSTGDIQLVSGYVVALRVSPFTANTIVGVEATEAPGYYDFTGINAGIAYQRWTGTSLSTMTRDKSFSDEDGKQILVISNAPVVEGTRMVGDFPSSMLISGLIYNDFELAWDDMVTGETLIVRPGTYDVGSLPMKSVSMHCDLGVTIQTDVQAPLFHDSGGRVDLIISGNGIFKQTENTDFNCDAFAFTHAGRSTAYIQCLDILVGHSACIRNSNASLINIQCRDMIGSNTGETILATGKTGKIYVTADRMITTGGYTIQVSTDPGETNAELIINNALIEADGSNNFEDNSGTGKLILNGCRIKNRLNQSGITAFDLNTNDSAGTNIQIRNCVIESAHANAVSLASTISNDATIYTSGTLANRVVTDDVFQVGTPIVVNSNVKA